MDLEFPTTAAALGRYFDASVIGNPDAEVHSLSPLPKASEGTLSFCASRKYGGVLNHIKGAVLFTRSELVRPELPLTYLVVSNPQSAFAAVVKKLSERTKAHGISPQACIDPTAVLEEGVSVGPFAVIEEGAVIGRGTSIAAHAFIGRKVTIGQDTKIYPQVVLLDGVQIGNRVKIFAGSVLGSEGFGLIQEQGELSEMPQIGTVVIEDDVRIGAKCTIDRGTFGETRVGAGSKLDDQVHLGHNVRLGRNCVLCGQTGVGGSSVLGDNVMMGGQAGISDHVNVGNGARLGGSSGTSLDLEAGGDYFLTPAMPLTQSLRVLSQYQKLPELAKRLRRIEIEITKLTTEPEVPGEPG